MFALSPLVKGFIIGSGLIIAIGPQNAFVIRCGLRRHYVFLIALLCVIFDTMMVTLGVLGLGQVLNLKPFLHEGARWFGVIFLTIYALLSFRSAVNPTPLTDEDFNQTVVSRKRIVLILLAVSFLNPYMYLDTVVLLGSIGAQFDEVIARYLFVLGVAISSAIWFFSISLGAKALSPFFKKKNAWRILDIFIGVIMLIIAGMLFLRF